MVKNLTIGDVDAFLKERPAITKTVFFSECGLGRNFIQNGNSKSSLRNSTKERVFPVMKKYGYKMKTDPKKK